MKVRKEDLELEFCNLLDGLAVHSTPLLQYLRKKVHEAWDVRQAEAIAQQGIAERRIKSLQDQKTSLLDKLLKSVIDEQTYIKKNTELDIELAITRSHLHNSALDEADVDGVLNLAEYALTNAGRLWRHMEPEHRPRFQRVLLGASVPYKVDSGFGTAEKAYPVSALKGFVDHDSSLAPPSGIEPLFSG